MKRIIIFACALLIAQSAFSQTVYKYGLPKGKDFDRWSVGVLGGISVLQSDLREKGDAANSTNNLDYQGLFGAHVGYQLSHSLGFNVQGVWGNFKEKTNSAVYVKEADTAVYLDFNSPMQEYSFNMLFSFGNISFIKRNTNLHFLLKTGVAMVITKPDLKYSKDKITYTPLNQPAQVNNVVLPLGFGVRYGFGKFNVGVDYDYRKAFTDKLEGLAVANSNYDGYSMITAQVNYVIGKKKKPMEWVNPMELVYNDISDVKEKVDGLGNDKDHDGVADIFDKDNSTPQGQKVYGDGTSVDTDGDGVPDSKDVDPYSSPSAKVDGTGKEIDTDGDGVPDSRDKENNTPAGSLVNFQGITINGAAKPNNGGNSSTDIKNENVTNNNGGLGFFPSVFFDNANAEIKSIYFDRFLTVARVMKMNPDLKIRIVGSADKSGDIESNNKLGQKRADAAKQHLVSVYGIDPARISTDTKGKNEPLAASTPNTDYLNRRVDFVIEGK